MNTVEPIFLSYLANAVWQIPLLFLTGWVAARAFRQLGPAAEHRVWVTVLVLQVLWPAASSIPADALAWLVHFAGDRVKRGQPQVSIVMGPGAVMENPHVPSLLLHLLVAAYLILIAWFAVRFAWSLGQVRSLRHSATKITLTGDAAAFWTHCARTFHVETASLNTSTQIYGPITVGIRHKLVLLPPEVLATLSDHEFRTVTAHEFAHMRRHDYFKNLLYELISLPVRFHPVVRLTRLRLMETREMICDQLAAGESGRHLYARSLLRLASILVDGMPVRTPHTIGIFDFPTFERRVMRLTRNPSPVSTLRRLTAAAVCALLGTAICSTTLILGVHVHALAASDQHGSSKSNGPITVGSGVMAQQLVHKVTPIYPAEAKKARIQGVVQLGALISTTGAVERLEVISGPKELQQSTLDAVRQWTYKPFLLHGEPVEVKTTIHVIYSLIDEKK